MSIRGPSKCVSLAKTNRGDKSRYTVPLRKKKILNFLCGGGAGRGGMERNEPMSLIEEIYWYFILLPRASVHY